MLLARLGWKEEEEEEEEGLHGVFKRLRCNGHQLERPVVAVSFLLLDCVSNQPLQCSWICYVLSVVTGRATACLFKLRFKCTAAAQAAKASASKCVVLPYEALEVMLSILNATCWPLVLPTAQHMHIIGNTCMCGNVLHSMSHATTRSPGREHHFWDCRVAVAVINSELPTAWTQDILLPAAFNSTACLIDAVPACFILIASSMRL
jgi:hypothetical protein